MFFFFAGFINWIINNGCFAASNILLSVFSQVSSKEKEILESRQYTVLS